MRSENTYNVVACDRFGEMAGVWLRASVMAHGFISRSYWEKNLEAMRNRYLPASENYACLEEGKVVGFISLSGNRVAALFVEPLMQGRGIGRALLCHAKGLRVELTLAVYSDNCRAAEFYAANGFDVTEERVDEATGCAERLMGWNRQ